MLELDVQRYILSVPKLTGTAVDVCDALLRAGRKRDVEFIDARIVLAGHVALEVRVSDKGRAFTVTNLTPSRRYVTSRDGVEKAFADVVRELYAHDADALDIYGRLLEDGERGTGANIR